MQQTQICGAVVFDRVVRALQLAEHAREILAVEGAVAAGRSQSAPVPPAEAGAPAAVPADGPLDVTAAVALIGPAGRPLVSRSTVYRLLDVIPAPITLGGAKKKSARWRDRAAFEEWLARALDARRLSLGGADPDPDPDGPTNSKGKRRALKPPESPDSGPASWAARRRARKDKSR
jgi:predicted DNA-binding transcriptional regulator AlpA